MVLSGWMTMSYSQTSLDFSRMNRGILHFDLPNGMTVILKEDRTQPVTAVHLRVKTGSIHEEGFWGAGLSHFFEHSLFLGSEDHPDPEAYSAEIESYGGANVNAYTTYDHTAYHFNVLSAYTKEGLNCIEDLVFHPLFPKERVRSEMGSIVSEMDMRNDNPDNFFWNFAVEMMFKNLPYRFPVIGYKERFQQLTREELLAYYRQTYVPGNMILSVVGDFDTREIIEHIRTLFGKHPAKKVDDLVFKKKGAREAVTAETSHPKAEYTRMAFAWRTISHHDADMYPLDVLSSFMGSGEGSILHQRLKEEKELVRNVSSISWTPDHSGTFKIFFDLPPLKDRQAIKERIEAIRSELFATIEKIRQGEFDSYHLNATKRAVLASFIQQRETTMGLAESLAGSVMSKGHTRYDEIYLRGIEAVNKRSISKVIRRYLTEKKMKIIVMTSPQVADQGLLFPNSLTSASILQKDVEYRRKKESPLPSKIRTRMESNEIDTFLAQQREGGTLHRKTNVLHRERLKSGIQFLHRRVEKIPQIQVVLSARGGLQAETQLINGSFQLLSQMFLTSNTRYTKEELFKLLRKHGIYLEPFSGKYSFGIKMTFLNDKVAEASQILESIVRSDRFDEKDFAKEKKDSLFAIRQNKENGWYVSGLHFRRQFFKGSIFENPSEGTEETIESLTAESLFAIKQKFFVPSNMVLSIYGDIDFKKAKNHFDHIFKAQASPPLIMSSIDLSPLVYRGEKDTVKKEMLGGRQAFLQVGFRGPEMKKEDSAAFKILDGYFSGMGGPLFKLRSIPYIDKQGRNLGGRAYQLGASYEDSLAYGAMVFYAALRYEAREEYSWMIDSFLKEIKKVKTGKISEADFRRAKQSILGLEAIGKQRLANLIMKENLYELYGYGAEHVETRRERLEKVDKKDIVRIARKYLKTRAMVVNLLMPGEEESSN